VEEAGNPRVLAEEHPTNEENKKSRPCISKTEEEKEN
jgi:hypothetical protein